MAQWRKAAEGHDPAIPAAVRERIAKIGDAAEMVALEGDLWRQVAAKRQTRLYHDMTLAMMQALGGNPRPAAAESLARYAAFSAFEDVRAAAVAGLKRRPLDHYVPLLLSGLQSPIEASMQWTLSATGDLITQLFPVPGGGAGRRVVLADGFSRLYSSRRFLRWPDAAVSVTPGTGTVEFDSPQEKQLLMRTDPGYVAAAYAQARADAAAVPAACRRRKCGERRSPTRGRREPSRRLQLNASVAGQQAQAVRNEAAMRDAVDRANRAIAQRNAQIVAALPRPPA